MHKHVLLFYNLFPLEKPLHDTTLTQAEAVEAFKSAEVEETGSHGLVAWNPADAVFISNPYVRSGLNSHYFHIIGDKLINPSP